MVETDSYFGIRARAIYIGRLNSAWDMLVSLLVLKVVTAVDGVVVNTFSSILFNFFYYNLGSKYMTESYRKYYSGFY